MVLSAALLLALAASPGAEIATATIATPRRPKDRIEAIEIIGNTKTSGSVIRGRLLVEVGDAVDDERIDQSRLRLLVTGYFKSVEFSARRGSRRGRVVLVIEVVERNTILIDGLYLGFSSIVPFYGGAGVHESNLLGEGVSAGLAFVAGRGRRAASFDVFVPDLSATRLQLQASGVYVEARELVDDEETLGPELSYRRVGGALGLGLGVGLAQRIVLEYRLESVFADPLPNLDPATLRRAPSIQFDDSILSTLSLIYEWDTRDDSFAPTRGARIGLGVETGTKLIGSSYEFTKYTADAALVLPGFLDHSLTLGAFAGLLQGRAPFFSQFFLSDTSYFAFGRQALPRALGVNFSESNDYDDLVASVNADYNVPIGGLGDVLLRSFVYGGVGLAITASLDELQEDASGRGIGDGLPLSFDAGVRLDTLIGNFTISISYIIELVL